jgi:hypothetical protein
MCAFCREETLTLFLPEWEDNVHASQRNGDIPVVEFGFGKAASGTDIGIGANCGGSKRLRHMTLPPRSRLLVG